MTRICPGLHQISVGVAHTFLLETNDGLALIDAGPQGEEQQLLSAVRQNDFSVSDINHILVTHAHQDHAGGLRTLKEETNATVWMQARDAELVEAGRARRPWSVTPQIFQYLLYWLFVRDVPDTVPAVSVDEHIADGDRLPFEEPLRVVHVPGHCAGQVAFLWERHGGVLFAADTALSLLGRPRLSIVYEDLEQGRKELRRLADLNFGTAVFGHGAPIIGDADEAFRRAAY